MNHYIGRNAWKWGFARYDEAEVGIDRVVIKDHKKAS